MCYELIEAKEAKRGKQFDFIIKTKADVVLLQNVVSPLKLPNNPHVPYGETWTSESISCHNEHIFECPRDQCRPYFMLSEIFTSSLCQKDATSSIPSSKPTVPYSLPTAPPKMSHHWYVLQRYGASPTARCSSGTESTACCGSVRQMGWEYALAKGNSTHGIIQLDRYSP